MYRILLSAMLLNLFGLSSIRAQDDSAKTTKSYKSALGRFNYIFVRVGYLFPTSGFNNPMTSDLPGYGNFSYTGAIPYSFRLGYESGRVRHFNKLNIGTPTLKLGINSGIGLQAFGPGDKTVGNAKVSTDGIYMMKLGIGPQVTFKPIEDLRLGLYYRANYAFLYSGYVNDETSYPSAGTVQTDEISVHVLNFLYVGDIGLDISWQKICVGISYTMMHTKPSSGPIVAPQKLGSQFDSYTVTTKTGNDEPVKNPTLIDPDVKWNHLNVMIGFAF